MFGDEIERIVEIDAVTGEILMELPTLDIFPATHFITPEEGQRLREKAAKLAAEKEAKKREREEKKPEEENQ